MTEGGAPLEQSAATRLVRDYLERHAATDLEGVLALFREDAVVEDPVGSPPYRGSAAIREFYRETQARNGPLAIEPVGPVLCGGDELVCHVRARLATPESAPEMDVIYALRVDEQGRIRSLRAFF